jgi:hypothetical protein
MSQPIDGQVNLPSCLQDVEIKSLPNGAYYIANFISEAEEAAILHKVSVVMPFCRCSDRWINDRSKRLPSLGGRFSPTGGSKHGRQT